MRAVSVNQNIKVAGIKPSQLRGTAELDNNCHDKQHLSHYIVIFFIVNMNILISAALTREFFFSTLTDTELFLWEAHKVNGMSCWQTDCSAWCLLWEDETFLFIGYLQNYNFDEPPKEKEKEIPDDLLQFKYQSHMKQCLSIPEAMIYV